MLTPNSARAPGRLSVAGLSINGVLLFATSFLVIASGFTSMRPDIMGLRLHPFLIPVGIAFPVVLATRISEFPPRIMTSLMIFTGIYTFSIFNGRTFDFGEVFKVLTSIVTIITCALLVRKRGDMVAGSIGLSLAIALLAVKGLQEPMTRHGIEVMEGTNKNSYSMFALPAILLAGYVPLRMPTVPLVFRAILIATSLPSLVVIFMSGNRSGYVCAALVGLMLFWDRRGKGLLMVGGIAAAVMFFIVNFGTTKIFDEKVKETMSGYGGDRLRQDIILSCIDIGFENPLIGVSPQTLPWEIGRRIQVKHGESVIESHNVFAHIWGASGILCFMSLLAVAWTMCAYKPKNGVRIGGAEDPLRDAVKLLRMMVILWAARGFFTRDILYNPSFCIGLGLAIGLCMLADVARAQTATGRGPEPSGQPPLPFGARGPAPRIA